jgi:hypothetical protein
VEFEAGGDICQERQVVLLVLVLSFRETKGRCSSRV